MALLYDILRRKSWATRTRDKVPELGTLEALEKETVVIDEVLLEKAKTNVLLTLQEATTEPVLCKLLPLLPSVTSTKRRLLPPRRLNKKLLPLLKFFTSSVN